VKSCQTIFICCIRSNTRVEQIFHYKQQSKTSFCQSLINTPYKCKAHYLQSELYLYSGRLLAKWFIDWLYVNTEGQFSSTAREGTERRLTMANENQCNTVVLVHHTCNPDVIMIIIIIIINSITIIRRLETHHMSIAVKRLIVNTERLLWSPSQVLVTICCVCSDACVDCLQAEITVLYALRQPPTKPAIFWRSTLLVLTFVTIYWSVLTILVISTCGWPTLRTMNGSDVTLQHASYT